jgi:NADPH-dependent glutamate synthase beta subunit-like oxidoreductase
MTLLQAEAPMNLTQALAEAARCLQCFDPPCTAFCPAGIVIPRFIRMIASGNLVGSAEVVRAANPLALSCGLACPDETLCASACTRAAIDRAVQIRRLHRFATEQGELKPIRRIRTSPTRRTRVAVVGAGPAGLACAAELRRHGIRVTLFEARRSVGGVLASIIPRYRFPDTAIRKDAAWAIGAGVVELKLGTAVDQVGALADAFDAVFLGPGLAREEITLEGSGLKGVLPAARFLERARSSSGRTPVGRVIMVIGGGNVAVDAAMTVIHCGEVQKRRPRPSVHLLYRRTRASMPAWAREVREAERVGVKLHELVIPLALIGAKGRVTGVRLVQAREGPPDASGRPRPVPVAGSEFTMECDAVITALGLTLDDQPLGGLPVGRNGLLSIAKSTGKLRGRIYAGGDAASPGGTIVTAVRDGKIAAQAIVASLAREEARS